MQTSYMALTLTDPTMPDNSSIYQKMIDTFGTAGTIAIAIIGGAVSLGIIAVLAIWAWRMLKKWINAAK